MPPTSSRRSRTSRRRRPARHLASSAALDLAKTMPGRTASSAASTAASAALLKKAKVKVVHGLGAASSTARPSRSSTETGAAAHPRRASSCSPPAQRRSSCRSCPSAAGSSPRPRRWRSQPARSASWWSAPAISGWSSASPFAKLGAKVTVVEAADRDPAALRRRADAAGARQPRALGVEVLTGAHGARA